MCKYRRRGSEMVVEVEAFEEEGRLYVRLHNDGAVLNIGGDSVPASPWCVEISEFGKRYEPVASLPKLGEQE